MGSVSASRYSGYCGAIGNLDTKRDWGHAADFVRGMWMMPQQVKADDYVLATGESHSVREFIEIAFAEIGRRIVWRGEGRGELVVRSDLEAIPKERGAKIGVTTNFNDIVSAKFYPVHALGFEDVTKYL
ncbi:MAG: GDP-mannose 4,6-dehydratase [Terriglobales bacterium]